MQTNLKYFDYLTVDQTAELLQLSKSSVRRFVSSREIPSIKLGNSIRIPRWKLDNQLEEVSLVSFKDFFAALANKRRSEADQLTENKVMELVNQEIAAERESQLV